jgi:steroid 5-alpha reductase family enzyme
MVVLYSLIISLLIQYAMFIPAFLLKTDKLTDISYGTSFVLFTIYFLATNELSFGKIVLAVMIVVWGIRLAWFLFKRIIRMKRDKRFDGMRESFFRFLGFWTLQGFTVWAVLLPSIIYFTGETAEISPLNIIGIVVFYLGFAIEVRADYQKEKFSSKGTGRWIETGLWKFSRHPNYFGEILVWVGIYLFTLQLNLSGLIGLVSPLYITFLLLKVSGVSRLEKRADARWSNNPEYLEYKSRTNLLLPLKKFW